MTGQPDHPDYLPPFPTDWPDTPEEAKKVVAAMRPRPNWRVAAAIAATVVLLIAVLAVLAPEAIGVLLVFTAVAVGAGGARRRR